MRSSGLIPLSLLCASGLASGFGHHHERLHRRHNHDANVVVEYATVTDWVTTFVDAEGQSITVATGFPSHDQHGPPSYDSNPGGGGSEETPDKDSEPANDRNSYGQSPPVPGYGGARQPQQSSSSSATTLATVQGSSVATRGPSQISYSAQSAVHSSSAPGTSTAQGESVQPPSSAAPYGGSGPSSAPPSSSSSPSSSAAAAPSATSTSTSAPLSSGGNLPFTQMVAFGDNLSDNGNGSSKHNVAGNPESIYGFNTWTNGPVAVSYLSDTLGYHDHFTDLAYGHAAGGSKFGATVDNSFTQSDANAPSSKDQINTYMSGSDAKSSMDKTFFFLWTGNNDALPYKHIFFGGDNSGFATQLAQKIADQAKTLVDAGAGGVLVPNVYPRHLAPVVATYFTNSSSDVDSYGEAIKAANTALESNLKPLGNKVLYYDAFTFMSNLWQNAGSSGFTHTEKFADFCDGAKLEAVPGTTNWDLCQKEHHANDFYWMQFLDPTTKVHQMLADDMAKAVNGHFGGK